MSAAGGLTISQSGPWAGLTTGKQEDRRCYQNPSFMFQLQNNMINIFFTVFTPFLFVFRYFLPYQNSTVSNQTYFYKGNIKNLKCKV